MKFRIVALSVALLVLTSVAALAQGGGCRSGGGRGPSASMGGTERASAFRGTLTSPTEVARQYLMQVQQQEMAKAYMQQMQETASHQARIAAQEDEEKRQEKISAIKERRAAELAKREATKARNLARRKAAEPEASTSHRTASLP
jgi:hypothetical protein